VFSTDLPPKNSVVREGALVETVVDLPLLPRRGALGLWVSGTDESVQEPLAAKPVDHQPAHQARIKAVSFIPPVLLAYIEGLKAHDVPNIARTVADDLRFVTPASTLTKEQFLTFLRALYSAFPDWHYDYDEPEVRANLIAVKWRQGGTHSSTLVLPGQAVVAATGKKVKISEQFFFYRMRDDQIVEIRPEPIAGGAPLGIFQQIGVEWAAPAGP
jgi:predicted ester cyclase